MVAIMTDLTINDLIQDHIDKFGVAPVITGINFADQETIWEGIEQAIENGVPYVEKELQDEEKA